MCLAICTLRMCPVQFFFFLPLKLSIPLFCFSHCWCYYCCCRRRRANEYDTRDSKAFNCTTDTEDIDKSPYLINFIYGERKKTARVLCYTMNYSANGILETVNLKKKAKLTQHQIKYWAPHQSTNQKIYCIRWTHWRHT